MTTAGAPEAVRLDELQRPCWILESWALNDAARNRLRTHDPGDAAIPPGDFERVPNDAPRRAEGVAPFKGVDSKQRADGSLEVSVKVWAGRRILAQRAAEGIWVEDVTFGSGVAVADARRFRVVPEFAGTFETGPVYAVPLSAGDKIDDVVLKSAMRALPNHQAISIEWRGNKEPRGPNGAVIRVISVERSAADVRTVRVRVSCEVVRGF